MCVSVCVVQRVFPLHSALLADVVLLLHAVLRVLLWDTRIVHAQQHSALRSVRVQMHAAQLCAGICVVRWL